MLNLWIIRMFLLQLCGGGDSGLFKSTSLISGIGIAEKNLISRLATWNRSTSYRFSWLSHIQLKHNLIHIAVIVLFDMHF